MRTSLRAALSRTTARVIGSRFAKPIARVVLGAGGLAILALVGRTAVAGAVVDSATSGSSLFVAAPREPGPSGPPNAADPSMISAAPGPGPQASAPPAASVDATRAADHPPAGAVDTPSLRRATPDDPVLLNSATESDLRRLNGIGAKRAVAILALRARLGRFRAVEDLLKVKGIGRATLKRLRPLIRIDGGPARPDAGS